MLNFGIFSEKNAITFDLTEIERNMKFCCASHAAIKNVKIARNVINFLLKIFTIKLNFFPKLTIFRKNDIYFRILEVRPVILTIYIPV